MHLFGFGDFDISPFCQVSDIELNHNIFLDNFRV